MPSGYCSLWEAQTGHIRTKTSVLKGLLKVKPVRTEGQSLFKKHRPVYLLQLRPPRGLSIWQGGLFRNSYGRAVPRLEGRRGGRRGGLRKQRGRKDKGAARRNGGKAGMRGHRKGGLFFFFYRFIIPGSHGRKTKNRNQRAIIHVGGGGISVPRQAPEFRLRVSPDSLGTPDGERNLSARGGGAGTDLRVSGAQHGPPRVTGRGASGGAPGSPLTRGAHFISHGASNSLVPKLSI